MSLTLEIPDDVTGGLRIPEGEQPFRLRLELACALYQRGLLSGGKAAELVGLDRHHFGRELALRGIHRHYTDAELQQDLAYARGE